MSLPVLQSRSHHSSSMAHRPVSSSGPPSGTKSLNFNQAMEDFCVMFPHLDNDVILTVLRANNGVVQTTIDQLLVISENHETEVGRGNGRELSSSIVADLPSYADYEDNFPNEPPPAYTEVDPVEQDSLDGFAGAVGGATAVSPNSPVIPHRNITRSISQTSRFWRHGLVCSLSQDFLRLSAPTNAGGSDNVFVTASFASTPTSNSGISLATNSADGFETEQELERYLEDERLAMFLQNEEFVRQLRHNPEFADAVEADHRRAVAEQSDPSMPDASSQNTGSTGQGTPVNDDVAFSLKLKHMGKSTRKRFGKLAKRFSRTRRSVKGSVGYPTESRFNLLDEDEGDIHETAGMDGYCRSETDSIDNNYSCGSESETSVSSPRSTAVRCMVNNEPIVFYSEDNEFELKREGSQA